MRRRVLEIGYCMQQTCGPPAGECANVVFFLYTCNIYTYIHIYIYIYIYIYTHTHTQHESWFSDHARVQVISRAHRLGAQRAITVEKLIASGRSTICIGMYYIHVCVRERMFVFLLCMHAGRSEQSLSRNSLPQVGEIFVLVHVYNIHVCVRERVYVCVLHVCMHA